MGFKTPVQKQNTNKARNTKAIIVVTRFDIPKNAKANPSVAKLPTHHGYDSGNCGLGLSKAGTIPIIKPITKKTTPEPMNLLLAPLPMTDPLLYLPCWNGFAPKVPYCLNLDIKMVFW
jgi:hypothetical protein